MRALYASPPRELPHAATAAAEPLTSVDVGVGDQLPVLDGVLPSDTDDVGVGLDVGVCVRVLEGVAVDVRVLDGVAVCELVNVRVRVRDDDQPKLTVADCRWEATRERAR